jgi:hypothetical protein
MRDVIYLLLTVGFFAVAAALVAACDRIVGADPSPSPTEAAPKEGVR